MSEHSEEHEKSELFSLLSILQAIDFDEKSFPKIFFLSLVQINKVPSANMFDSAAVQSEDDTGEPCLTSKRIDIECVVSKVGSNGNHISVQLRVIEKVLDVFLQKTREQFQQQLSMTLSHEIMNPLNTVLTMSDLL